MSSPRNQSISPRIISTLRTLPRSLFFRTLANPNSKTHQEKQPLLSVQQHQGLEGIGSFVHRGLQRAEPSRQVSTSRHFWLWEPWCADGFARRRYAAHLFRLGHTDEGQKQSFTQTKAISSTFIVPQADVLRQLRHKHRGRVRQEKPAWNKENFPHTVREHGAFLNTPA